MSTHPKLHTALARELKDLRERLGYSRRDLAAKLEVKPSTVSVWEVARSRGYKPSADILVRFANLAAASGNDFDKDCIRLLNLAGALSASISRVLDRDRNRRTTPQPSKPGEIVSLPRIDPASGFSRYPPVEVPASLICDRGSVACVRIESEIPHQIKPYPFGPGGLLAIDQSETDLEVLLRWEPSFAPVAIHYSRLPNRPLFEPSAPAGASSHSRDVLGVDLDPEADQANARELWEKYGEYLRDPSKKWDVAGIHVGWLRLLTAGQRWCVVLSGASVTGRWTGSTLEITRWHEGPVFGSQPTLTQLVAEDIRVLGRVVLWLPDWSHQPAGRALVPKAKSRKGLK